MAMPDLDILRDIDAQLAELRMELRLHRQEARFRQRETLERLRALEARTAKVTTPLTLIQFLLLHEKTVIKTLLMVIGTTAGVAVAGKPFAPLIAVLFGGKP